VCSSDLTRQAAARAHGSPLSHQENIMDKCPDDHEQMKPIPNRSDRRRSKGKSKELPELLKLKARKRGADYLYNGGYR